MKDFLDFKKHFKFHSYYFSIATIQKSNHDERSLMINKKDRRISVLGGKIDTAIKAEEEIKKIIYE